MPQVTVTAKIKILPGRSDKDCLDKTLSAYTDACCFVSDYVFRTHTAKKASLHDALYHEIRLRFGLKSQMAESVLRTVTARYQSIRTNRQRRTKPVFSRPQCDLVWNRDYSLSGDRFSVNTLEGRIKVPFCRKGMEKYFGGGRFGTAKLYRNRGRYYLLVPVTCDVPECRAHDLDRVVGIDRGIRFTATAYDSDGRTTFFNGRQIKQKRAHYKELRRQLQMRKTPSARRRLKAIGQRENRWMSDVNHQVSKALSDSYPAHTLFVLEDLSGIRSATEAVKVKDRYVQVSWSYYDLEQKLIYKAKKKGSMVVKMDPRYTSQRCPVCGHTEKANRSHETHTFRCLSCGYTSNDDRIGAMNLYQKGENLLRDRILFVYLVQLCAGMSRTHGAQSIVPTM